MIPGFCGSSNSFFTSQAPTAATAHAPAMILAARARRLRCVLIMIVSEAVSI
jgi:hypothetical protein